jgi:hypothetical protein
VGRATTEPEPDHGLVAAAFAFGCSLSFLLEQAGESQTLAIVEYFVQLRIASQMILQLLPTTRLSTLAFAMI